MAEATLQVNTREEKGKQAMKKLRQEGFVPGVLYGPGKDPSLLSINSRELFNLLHSYGRNVVVNLNIGDGQKNVKTFIFEIQHDPITDNIIHVDFKHISLDVKIHVAVPVHLEGIPVGVRSDTGITEHIMHTIEIRCFPIEIPEEIVINIEDLEIGDSIHVKDIGEKNFEILSEKERTVVHVIAPKVVAVVEEVEEVVEGEELEIEEEPAEPEVIGKEDKKEEE